MMKDLEKVGAIGVVATELCPVVGIVLLGAAVLYGGFVLGEKMMDSVAKKKCCLVSKEK